MPTSSFLEMLSFEVLMGLRCYHPTKEGWKYRSGMQEKCGTGDLGGICLEFMVEVGELVKERLLLPSLWTLKGDLDKSHL